MADEVTHLPPGQEAAFEQWLQRNHVNDLDHPDSHYDYRGAFLAGVGRAPGTEGHFTDRFKQHGHPTFSEESQYSKGPGDGGSWDGERFIPGKPVTPGFLPGQPPIGYGMTPGVHHNVTTGRDDMTGDPEPLPDAGPVVPDKIDLDAPEPGAAPAPPEPIGWRIKNKDGSVLAEFHNVNTQEYQKQKVQRVGEALISQAVTPDDKEAAQRATAYGLALVGVMPEIEITKRMAAMYQADERNLLARSIQAEKSKRSLMRGGGGPVGPSKADKFENQVDLDDAKLTESIVNNEQTQSKVNALHDMESDLDKLEAMVSSPNALAQRAGIMEYMKTLSGKQSTDAERRQLSNANGIIDALTNNISLWGTDPTLAKGYIQQFKSLVRTLRGSVAKRKAQIGKESADRLIHQPRFAKKDEATKKALGNYGRGVVTGEYDDPAAPGAPKTAVDDDLLK